MKKEHNSNNYKIVLFKSDLNAQAGVLAGICFIK